MISQRISSFTDLFNLPLQTEVCRIFPRGASTRRYSIVKKAFSFPPTVELDDWTVNEQIFNACSRDSFFALVEDEAETIEAEVIEEEVFVETSLGDVNPNEAPDGFFATEMVDECVGCCFISDGPCPTNRPCLRDEREDGCDVIFKRKEDTKDTPSQHEPGAKLDDGKPRVGLMFECFPRALWKVAELTTIGAVKYSPYGCLSVKDGEARYFDAEGRHMLKRCMGKKDGVEAEDPDTKALELAAIAWNALMHLELYVRRMEEEDVEG